MKEGTIKRIGRLFRMMQFHHFPKLFLEKNNVRITYTHHLFSEDLGNFDALVKYATSKRRVITPQVFFDSFKKKSFQGDSILFTFDDGLLSSYCAAKEILSRYNIKAIFFVPTEILELRTEVQMKEFAVKRIYFNRRKEWSLRKEEYLTMNKEQLVDLFNEGHMIFPHTHSHCRLRDIKDSQGVQKEIIWPKETLRDLLGCEIDAFAFPVGTERVVSSYAYSEIKKNYQFCFTGLGGINTVETDRYFLHRDCLHANTELSHLRNTLEGSYDLFYLFKMHLLKNVAKDINSRHYKNGG